MDDLIDEGDGASGGNDAAFSVSELSAAVKRAVESGFSHVRVRGEVGRVSRPRSGHVYLDLKDDRAVLAGVIWKGVAAGLRTQPEEGMEVIATGRLTTFPGQSRYQIVIESLAPAGMGALMAMLEKRRKALAAEGLFDDARKRPLPFLPRVIGVVTSPTGAVIRDILHRLRDRFPRHVLVWPVKVQGHGSAEEVAAAIRGFNALEPGGPIPRPDVLIVARGGGSVEDLWGFNEEIVVRAAAGSTIPLISAVGHETDTTLIDLAADRRAPTPTAAAEVAVPVRRELIARLSEIEARLVGGLSRTVRMKGERLRDLSRVLPKGDAILAERRQRLDILADRLPRALLAGAQAKRVAYAQRAGGRFGPALLEKRVREERRGVEALGRRLRPDRLSRTIGPGRERLATSAARFDVLGGRLTDRARNRLVALSRLLGTLDYRSFLDRGFVIVRDGAGQVVKSHEDAARQPVLELQFQGDQRLTVFPADKPRPKPAPKRRGEGGGGGTQGSLF